VRVLVAPDKFKGSLSAFEAAEAMARGALRAGAVDVDVCPLSDGGEGFVRVALAAAGGERRTARVMGPAGSLVDATWGVLPGGTAVIESAATVGWALVGHPRLGPSAYTTYGLGELVLHAVDGGAREVVLGLGGTTTNDGGIGMAQALGARFAGGGRPLTGGDLAALRSVDTSGLDPRLAGVEILGVTDVDNPLTGPSGAARVYGPQKGADAAEVERLDAGLAQLAAICADPGDRPGDGAAGGLGYGVRVLARGRIASGAEWVLDLVRFDDRLGRCDLVLTGEGHLDAQSLHGKVVAAIARRCAARGVPVVAIAGSVSLDESDQGDLGLGEAVELPRADDGERGAIERAATLVEEVAERVVRQRSGGR
jgi:glycerate kinase